MKTSAMDGDRSGLLAGLLASGWLLLMVVVDIAAPATVVPDPLFAIAPLIACSVLSPRITAAFGGVAVVLLIGSGWWNHTWDTPQQWIRLLDVILVSGAAVVVATVRVHREQRLTRMAAIAEAAQRAILPTVPAATQGLQTASRYLSAAQDAVVGGDLYDCSVTEGYPVHRRRRPRQGIRGGRACRTSDPSLPAGGSHEGHAARGCLEHERILDSIPG